MSLVSIAVDIAYSSPRTFPVCSAIISKLVSVMASKTEGIGVIRKIHAKLSQLPNTGHMEVWLQRISHLLEPQFGYTETLCRLVKGEQVEVWNNDWITSAKLKAVLDPSKIFDKDKLRALNPVIQPKEIEVFASERY